MRCRFTFSITRQRSTLIAGALALATLSFGAEAGAVEHQLRFGPFVGGGSATTGLSVRHSSGVVLSASQLWSLSERIQVGPHIEFTNSYVSVRGQGQVASPGDGSELGVYDNRSFAGGVALSVRPLSSSGLTVALTLAAGRSFAKLSFDETGDDSFTQSYFQGIEGAHFTGELGAQLPLQENLGLNVALLSQAHRLDQSDSKGTYAGDVTRDGNTLNLAGSYDDSVLPDTLVLRNYGVRVGITVSL